MNKKLVAGLVAAGVLAGGGGAAVAAAGGAAPASASTVAATPSTQQHTGGPLEPLVVAGTINRTQATAIHDALMTYLRGHWRDMRGQCDDHGESTPWMLESGGALDTALSRLVANGTLSRAQSAAVHRAFTQWTQTHDSGGHGQHQGGWGMMGGRGMGMS